MPQHSYRWAKYEIEYKQPTGKFWRKTWTRSVMTDPEIDSFKRDCQNAFLTANPGANIVEARTVFNDGFKNAPTDAKQI